MIDYTKFNRTLDLVKAKLERDKDYNNVVEAYVFGSYAKKTAGSLSDLDIYLIFKDSYYYNSCNHINIRRYSRVDLYDPKAMEVELDVHFCSESLWNENKLTLVQVVKETGFLIWRNSNG